MPGSSPFFMCSTLVIYTIITALTFNCFHLKLVYDPPSLIVPEALDSATLNEESIPTPKRSEHESPTNDITIEQSDAIIDWTDKIFRPDGWDNEPIVIESHKLLFFTVPKNACSTFKQLFRRMMGHGDWLEGNPHNPEDNGLKYLGHYSKDQQKEFMTSPEWTRAIFVRDPLERALSAYMDKGLKTGPKEWQPVVTGHHMKHKCCQQLENLKIPECRKFPMIPFENDLTEENFPFDSFVTSFMAQCDDPHWRPQHLRMRRGNWKWINFVGHFENKQKDTRRLLEVIGAYDEFGATGWGRKRIDSNATLSIFEKNLANHKTGSGDKMKEYYSTKTERLVLQHYRLDYNSEVFNLTKPVDNTQKLFGRKKKNQNQNSAGSSPDR